MRIPTFLGALYLSLAASIWGGMYVVSKYVLHYVPPLTLVWIRFVIAFLVLYFLLKLLNRRKVKHAQRTFKDWLLIGWIGFIGYFISITCQFIGTKLSDAHTGALITSATPAFTLLFAKVVLKESLTTNKLLSLMLATVGVSIVIGWDTEAVSYLWGSLILVVAAVTWALLSIYVKVASVTFTSLEITTYGIGFAILFITPFMIGELQYYPVEFIQIKVLLGIIYLGIISTAGAFFLWNQGMRMMEAGRGSLFFFLQPVVGSFFGWYLLNEKLESSFFIGGAFIVVGVLLATLNRFNRSYR